MSNETRSPSSAAKQTGQPSTASDKTTLATLLAQAVAERDTLKHVIDAQLDTFFLFEPDTGKALRWNRAFSNITGYTDKEIAELPAPASYYSPEDLVRAETFVQKALKEGHGTIELELLCKDGRKIPAEYRVSAIVDDRGQRTCLVAIGRDITDRKKAEESLRESEERFRGMFENMSSGVAIYEAVDDGQDFVFMGFNPAAEKIERLAVADVIGRRMSELFPSAVEIGVLEVFQRVWRTGEAEQFPVVFYQDERIEGWRENYIYRLPSGEVIAIYDDCTVQKVAEREREEAYAFLQTVINGFPGTLLVINRDYSIALANESARLIGAHKSQDITCLKCHCVFQGSLEPCTDDDHPCPMSEVLRTRKMVIVEHVHYDAKGDEVTVEVIAAPIFNAEGEVFQIVETSFDITERKRLEQRLWQTDKMDSIGQLAGGVAHDFNNQLGGIMNYADLLLSKTDDEELRRYADAIIRSCTRGKDLTGQLLAFSRKGKYQDMSVNIHRTIREAVSMLEHSIDKRIAIRQILEANPATTTGDPTQLQNALLNLGINARDAMPNGGELVFTTSTVTLDEGHFSRSTFGIVPGDYLKVTVADSGTGMDEATRAKVFEPFFTTKMKGKGTGMGLASAYGTVVNHHGAIEVDSEVGKGTTMTVYLPVSREEVQEEAATVRATTESSKVRILLVDDEEGVRVTTALLLRRKGYKVVTCEDGIEAVAYYKKSWQHIDLVLLDMNMPVMNGRDAFVAMREINPDIRTILATGYSLDSSAQEILDEGALGHIQKPFHIQDLIPQIEQALGCPS